MMIPKKYVIYWVVGGEKHVWAFSEEEALILAKADRINDGLDYSVKQIVFFRRLKYDFKEVGMKWINKLILRIRRDRIERESELKLLVSMEKSLKELAASIDSNHRYGNAIKTTHATRY